MAQTERQKEEKQGAISARRREKLDNARGARVEVAVNDFPWPEFLNTLRVVLDAGGAIRIGRTMDKGAWAFGLYGLGEKVTIYAGSRDDYFEVLEQIAEAFRD